MRGVDIWTGTMVAMVIHRPGCPAKWERHTHGHQTDQPPIREGQEPYDPAKSLGLMEVP